METGTLYRERRDDMSSIVICTKNAIEKADPEADDTIETPQDIMVVATAIISSTGLAMEVLGAEGAAILPNTTVVAIADSVLCRKATL
jgi:hypothetical protein